MCASLRACNTTPLLKDLKWPTLEQLVMERDAAMLHRIMHSPHVPDSLSEQIVLRSEVSERETRASLAGSLQLPRVRTEHGRRSFPYRAAATWNRTSVAVREARSWHVCRKELRKWMNDGELSDDVTK